MKSLAIYLLIAALSFAVGGSISRDLSALRLREAAGPGTVAGQPSTMVAVTTIVLGGCGAPIGWRWALFVA